MEMKYTFKDLFDIKYHFNGFVEEAEIIPTETLKQLAEEYDLLYEVKELDRMLKIFYVKITDTDEGVHVILDLENKIALVEDIYTYGCARFKVMKIKDLMNTNVLTIENDVAYIYAEMQEDISECG